MRKFRFTTPSGIEVTRSISKVPYKKGLRGLLEQLDTHRGFYLSSGYEYPGRYSRWDIASVCPPLEIVAVGRRVEFRPLNARGRMLLEILMPVIEPNPHWESVGYEQGALCGTLKQPAALFTEEERSKQPSAFSILRALIEEFRSGGDARLPLVGAFGYDLLFRFDPIQTRLERGKQKDLHLYFCDDIYYMDRKKERIERYQYDFDHAEFSTLALAAGGEPLAAPVPAAGAAEIAIQSDHTPEEYVAKVETVREGMRRGDYYEVVLRQTFRTPYTARASQLFDRIQRASPSPYQFLLQLGDEQLVGASPEMFVRVEGDRVETCPISGTARRTGDPLRDAENIRALLNSPKEESELTMCTDVDRNDKSRVSVPGSVRVIGRRLIEAYAGIFHTVDHVEGRLDKGFDSLDAFLTHMWAVTVIGAPKKAAAQTIENLEKDARGWYGGAVGMISLNGDMNTGILIRTVHLRDGVAAYSTGATLLYDSVPAMEEQETRMKATVFFRALRGEAPAAVPAAVATAAASAPRRRARMMLVDNDDCFIHTLANYARQTGAEVVTYRWGFPLDFLGQVKPDLILVSPGPGRPADFGVPDLVLHAAGLGVPVFGVCLGLQGIVEAFGGELGVLDYPMHGKPSIIRHFNRGIFEGLPERFTVGRYHSLFARRETFPACLEVTAETEDGVIMGVRHRELPIEAVQFHPESMLTLEGDCGFRLMENVVNRYGVLRQEA